MLPADHPDGDLVKRLLDGDEQAFSDLVRAHHATMNRVARGYLPSESAAEEVVQETWLAVLDGLSRFAGRSSLKTWIFRILANRAQTRGRREGRMRPISAMGALGEDGLPAVDPDRFAEQGMWARPPVEFGGGPDSFADRAEIRQVVAAAIAELPERQQLVITLRDVEGLSSDDVCNVLEISATNQRVLLHRARSKVRATLEVFVRGEQ